MKVIRIEYWLLSLFVLLLLALDPGVIFYDSFNQLQQAISGVYFLHHPPLMAFLWSLMLKIYFNSSTMFIFNLILVIAAVGLYYTALSNIKNNKVLLFYLFIPLMPWVMLYEGQILKDCQFVFSFMFVSSMLLYITMRNNELKITTKVIFHILILVVLFYGTSVKYQAKFVLPFYLFWLASLQFKKNLYRLIIWAIYCFVIIEGINIANNYLITKKEGTSWQDGKSWQTVKLFDLIGISALANQDLIPDFIKTKDYDFDKLKSIYYSDRVIKRSDIYPYDKHNFFCKINDDKLLDQLQEKWKNSVRSYSFNWLEHRAQTLYFTLIQPWLIYPPKFLKDTSYSGNLEYSEEIFVPDKVNIIAEKITIPYIKAFRLFLKPLLWALLIIYSFILSIKTLLTAKDFVLKKIAFASLILNSSALFFLLVILFMTAATDSRFLLYVIMVGTFSLPITCLLQRDNIISYKA